MLNPPRGTWTERQAATAKDRAERFERNVLEDDDAGDDFASMSIEEFAERHRKQIIHNNPKPQRSVGNMKTISRRKSGNGNGGNGGNGGRRRNQSLATSESDSLVNLATTNERLSKRNDALEEQNNALQSKLDEARDILQCDDPQCSLEEHVEDALDALENGDGNDGNGDDDD